MSISNILKVRLTETLSRTVRMAAAADGVTCPEMVNGFVAAGLVARRQKNLSALDAPDMAKHRKEKA